MQWPRFKSHQNQIKHALSLLQIRPVNQRRHKRRFLAYKSNMKCIAGQTTTAESHTSHKEKTKHGNLRMRGVVMTQSTAEKSGQESMSASVGHAITRTVTEYFPSKLALKRFLGPASDRRSSIYILMRKLLAAQAKVRERKRGPLNMHAG